MGSINLEGKVAVVTGASRGIGEAVATAFATHGAKVVIASRKEEGLRAAAERISAVGGDVTIQPCHVGKAEQVQALLERAVDVYGQVDVVVNNAATNVYFGPMVGTDDGAWHKIFQVNLESAFHLTRLLASHLADRGAGGCVVNMASIAGLLGAPLQGVYAMTKAALISMTRTLALELGPAGVRVNAIAPGLIKTRFASALVDSEDIAGPIVKRTPLGRLGEPEDIAGAALFLASDAASFVTGHTLVVDGGLTMSAFAP